MTISIRRLFGLTLKMSLAADPAAATKVNNCLKDLFKQVKQCENTRTASEPNLNTMTSLHKKIESENKLTGANKIKLKQIYEEAIEDVEKEEDAVRKALESIYEIRRIRAEVRIASRNAGNKETIRRGALMKMLATSAETIPLWVGKEDEDPPALCGAVPCEASYISVRILRCI